MSISFTVTEDEAGERVDALIARKAQSPRAVVQRALAAGELTVNGERVRPSYRVAAEDVVAGVARDPTTGPPGAETIPLDIRYSDDRVLVISKPPGLVTHPGHGHAAGTLVNALIGLGEPLSSVDPQRPGIVHRLDKGTSGLLIVAKDDDAHAHLASALKARRVRRGYTALVRGVPAVPTGSVDAPIARHPRRRTAMAVVVGGRRAVTHFRVLNAGDKLALLDIELETGRTHQIRVHLAHIGHPVMGDRTYGGMSEAAQALGLTRPFLHASRLAFPHPDDDRMVEVTDELPPDLAAVLARAGLVPPAG